METKKESTFIGSVVRLLCPLWSDETVTFGIITDTHTSNKDHPIWEISYFSPSKEKIVSQVVTSAMIEKVPFEECSTEQFQLCALVQCPEERRDGLIWRWLKRKEQNIQASDVVKLAEGFDFLGYDFLVVEYVKDNHACCIVKYMNLDSGIMRTHLPLGILDVVPKPDPVSDPWVGGVRVSFGNTSCDIFGKPLQTLDLTEMFQKTLSSKIQPKVTV